MDQGPDPVERVAQYLRAAVAGIHRDSAREPIRWPDASGAFPADFLLRPPPVVVDANILRNDVLRSCRTGQWTVLVTAANAGLLRMFCAEHVYQEVIKHSGNWTASGPITRAALRLPSLIHDELPRLGVRSHGLVQADRIEAAGHWNSGKAPIARGARPQTRTRPQRNPAPHQLGRRAGRASSASR